MKPSCLSRCMTPASGLTRERTPSTTHDTSTACGQRQQKRLALYQVHGTQNCGAGPGRQGAGAGAFGGALPARGKGPGRKDGETATLKTHESICWISKEHN